MKQLRKTIRKILLENLEEEGCAEIVTLMRSGDLQQMQQGVKRAEAMGYITGVHYNAEKSYYFPEFVHTWNFVASEELMDEHSEQEDASPSPEGVNFYTPNYSDVTMRLRIKDQA